MTAENQQLTSSILSFLNEIGIPTVPTKLTRAGFVPGMLIEGGCIHYDPEAEFYPGDFLHEAGHIACTRPEFRSKTGTAELPEWPDDGNEIAAVIWSYAAGKHLNLSPEVVFHPDGYKGESDWLIETFEGGSYIGLPLLVWLGLCDDPAKSENPENAFPRMKKWLVE